MRDYQCEDCGRMHLSIAAMMRCPCDRVTVHGYPRTEGDA